MSIKHDDPFPPHFSAAQKEFWRPWLLPELGPQEHDRWLGYCPKHQPEKEGEEGGQAGASYDLWMGSWWCLGPENCNAPKKAGTTTTLAMYIDSVVHAAF